jgi:putative metalloprotease
MYQEIKKTQMKLLLLILCLCFFPMSGCEDMDIQKAIDAGADAVKAVTLSDKDILELAEKTTKFSDQKHNLASPENKYSVRLRRVVGEQVKEGNQNFNFGVYLSPQVNALAMANGSIRLYSGLMDMLNDGELRFVIGHEMGHVMRNHIRKKIRLAYATSAVRKGVASQNNLPENVARSLIGDLEETLMNAQFSQAEEKEADDYGLTFLKRKKVNPQYAVSALKKIAGLGKGHSFLSSHPDPDKRAKRLQAQLEGKALPIEEKGEDLLARIKAFLATQFPWVYKQIDKLFPKPVIQVGD